MSLLRQVQVRGIRQIAGDVVLDRTAFNVPAIDPGAFDDKPMRPVQRRAGWPAASISGRCASRCWRTTANRASDGNAERGGLRIDNQLKRSASRVRQQLEGPGQRAPAAGKRRPAPRIHRQLRRAVRREAAQPGACRPTPRPAA